MNVPSYPARYDIQFPSTNVRQNFEDVRSALAAAGTAVIQNFDLTGGQIMYTLGGEKVEVKLPESPYINWGAALEKVLTDRHIPFQKIDTTA